MKWGQDPLAGDVVYVDDGATLTDPASRSWIPTIEAFNAVARAKVPTRQLPEGQARETVFWDGSVTMDNYRTALRQRDLTSYNSPEGWLRAAITWAAELEIPAWVNAKNVIRALGVGEIVLAQFFNVDTTLLGRARQLLTIWDKWNTIDNNNVDLTKDQSNGPAALPYPDGTVVPTRVQRLGLNDRNIVVPQF